MIQSYSANRSRQLLQEVHAMTHAITISSTLKALVLVHTEYNMHTKIQNHKFTPHTPYYTYHVVGSTYLATTAIKNVTKIVFLKLKIEHNCFFYIIDTLCRYLAWWVLNVSAVIQATFIFRRNLSVGVILQAENSKADDVSRSTTATFVPVTRGEERHSRLV